MTSPRDGFAAWFWDFDNDGVLDIFVGAYTQGVEHVAASYLGLPHKAELCCLYRGDGAGGFENVAAEKNLVRVTQPMGVNFGDLDNDGFLDFYLGTGYPAFEALMPNVMYHNQRGRRFADVSTSGGFGHLQKGHGVTFADLDQDGDQDVFIQLGGRSRMSSRMPCLKTRVRQPLARDQTGRPGIEPLCHRRKMHCDFKKTVNGEKSSAGSTAAGVWAQSVAATSWTRKRRRGRDAGNLLAEDRTDAIVLPFGRRSVHRNHGRCERNPRDVLPADSIFKKNRRRRWHRPSRRSNDPCEFS